MTKSIENSSLTILTDPMPIKGLFFPYYILKFLKFLKFLKYSIYMRKYFQHKRYRGHFAVTRSLIEGLEKLNKAYTYNPTKLSQLSDTVLVLSGVKTLLQAIKLKQQGYIKILFAGPNIVEFASDSNHLIFSDYIDCVVTPSEFITDLYLEDVIDLGEKPCVLAWPAGVNESFWVSIGGMERKLVLVYCKYGNNYNEYLEYILNSGYQYKVITYGNYDQYEYKELLKYSCVCVCLTETSESQGIAWAEAWSMDVPTLVKSKKINTIKGRKFKCSSAPYLNKENGLFFDDYKDFTSQFDYIMKYKGKFNPRSWVIENMTDKVSAKKMCTYIASYNETIK